jgi:hypothetical protein
MPVRDKNMAGRLKRIWIPVQSMAGIDVARTATLANGVPVFQAAVAAAEISGLAMASAGDEVAHFMPIPWDLDRDFPMRFRIWFAHSTTDTDNPDWLITVTYSGKQILIPAPDAAADDTLTFPALAVSATADAIEVLPFQACDESKIAATDFAMSILVEANGLGSAGANEITLLGIEIEYTRGGRSEGGRLNTDDAPAVDTKVDSGVGSY